MIRFSSERRTTVFAQWIEHNHRVLGILAFRLETLAFHMQRFAIDLSPLLDKRTRLGGKLVKAFKPQPVRGVVLVHKSGKFNASQIAVEDVAAFE